MSFTSTNLPTRPVEELRGVLYADMNSAEIDKLRREDPSAYNAVETAFNAQFTPPPPPEGGEPIPAPRTREIYRNGQLVDTSTAIKYVNGIPQ